MQRWLLRCLPVLAGEVQCLMTVSKAGARGNRHEIYSVRHPVFLRGAAAFPSFAIMRQMYEVLDALGNQVPTCPEPASHAEVRAHFQTCNCFS